MKNMIKIYEIKFNTYTNALKDTVCDDQDRFLDVPEHFLIREDKIEYYKQFGNGIRTLTYVGDLDTEV